VAGLEKVNADKAAADKAAKDLDRAFVQTLKRPQAVKVTLTLGGV